MEAVREMWMFFGEVEDVLMLNFVGKILGLFGKFLWNGYVEY